MKRKKTNFKVGDQVRSRYAAPWYGTILLLEKRKNAASLATVEVILDRRKNPMRKTMFKTLDAGWLEATKF